MGNCRQFFKWIDWRHWFQAEEPVRLDVEAPRKYPCPAACALRLPGCTRQPLPADSDMNSFCQSFFPWARGFLSPPLWTTVTASTVPIGQKPSPKKATPSTRIPRDFMCLNFSSTFPCVQYRSTIVLPILTSSLASLHCFLTLLPSMRTTIILQYDFSLLLPSLASKCCPSIWLDGWRSLEADNFVDMSYILKSCVLHFLFEHR